MARPRKATEILERNGAFAHNPNRRRPIGPKSNQPIGDPLDWLDDTECEIWTEIVRELPEGVLTEGDRQALAVLVTLRAKLQKRIISAVEQGQLIKLLGKFGMSPGDRSYIAATAPKQEDEPFAEFQN